MEQTLEISSSHALSYEVINDGPGRETIILLNGSAFNLHQWDRIIKFGFMRNLESRYRVIRYDYGGIGRSRNSGQEWDLFNLAEELHSLMDGLSLNRAHFFGLSKGTMVMQTFALKYPHRVHSLAGYAWYNFLYSGLASIVRKIFERRLAAFQELKPLWEQELSKDNFDKLWEKVYRDVIFQKDFKEFTVKDRIKEFLLRKKLFGLLAPTPIGRIYGWFDYAVHGMQEMIPFFEESLENLATLPLLIQHSAFDNVLPIGMAEELVEILPSADFIRYGEGYSHISIAFDSNQARNVGQDYFSFLRRLDT